jgi:hypothetical protein
LQPDLYCRLCRVHWRSAAANGLKFLLPQIEEIGALATASAPRDGTGTGC